MIGISKRFGKTRIHRRRTPGMCSVCGKKQGEYEHYAQYNGNAYCIPCMALVRATAGIKLDAVRVSGEKIGHRKRQSPKTKPSSKGFEGQASGYQKAEKPRDEGS